MFIDKNGNRINPYTVLAVNLETGAWRIVDLDSDLLEGETLFPYNILKFPEAVAAVGIKEIAEPTPPDDYSEDTYYRTEPDGAPYVVYTRKPQEMIDQQTASKAATDAQIYLDGTDYLFTGDRYAELLTNEPDRAADVKSKREQARETIRAYRTKYQKASS